MIDHDLTDLATAAGIATEWHDFAGRRRHVPLDALRAVLDALGYPCRTRDDIANSRDRLRPRPGLDGLAALVTARAGDPIQLQVETADVPKAAKLLLETGSERDIAVDHRDGRLLLEAVAEPGYHRLLIGAREIVLAVAPGRAITVDDIAPHGRLWGLAAQIYRLRRPGQSGSGDGGIGDAQSVALLAETAARAGADAVALSPVHAMFSAQPRRYGPYSPSSRLFLNPLYAAPSLVFGEPAVARAAALACTSDAFAELERGALIDWPASAAAKDRLFRALFADLVAGDDISDAIRADFAQFEADGGSLLAAHATFEALHAEQIAADPDRGDWQNWPSDLCHPDSPSVAAFAQAHRRDVLFHVFLQWLADRSLGAAQRRAHAAGMRVGLIADLAVGMDPAGSHAWSRPADILGGLSVGAPPDLFNPNGQQWGITTFSPQALRTSGFAPFLATFRAALRNAGGVRIDHAMGLQRLWLVPQGASPADGAYLAYPLIDMLRLLALESLRHHAIVVGEDLGTVPEGFRPALDAHGVLGMRVLWFERRQDNTFCVPEEWDRGAVAMTSTHDLPTVAGWWQGADIALRAEHGVLGKEQRREDVEAEREQDRGALWHAFREARVADNPPPAITQPEPFVGAALRFVARTQSPLCLLPLEDVLGEVEQPNLPGTVTEHPNWRRRTTRPVSELLDDPAIGHRLADVARERPRR